MGARGPKPGWKSGKAAPQAPALLDNRPTDTQPVPVVAALLQPQPVIEPEAPAVPVSSADRENPDKLTGAALRELAHRRGLSRSAVATMAESKIRTELRYLAYRQYEDA